MQDNRLFSLIGMYKIACLAFLLAFKKCRGDLKLSFFSGGLEMIRVQLVD